MSFASGIMFMERVIYMPTNNNPGAVCTQAMLMGNQHLYESPAIEVYAHCRLLLPIVVDVFCNPG